MFRFRGGSVRTRDRGIRERLERVERGQVMEYGETGSSLLF